MNKAFLIGRLVKDIELRYTTSNKAVVSTTIAVNRPKREDGSQETDFINLVVWGKQAENLQKYCPKGSQIAVDGRIQIRDYEDQNGQKRYVTEVVAENIQFLDTKKEEDTPKADKHDMTPYEEMGAEIEENPDLPFRR